MRKSYSLTGWIKITGCLLIIIFGLINSIKEIIIEKNKFNEISQSINNIIITEKKQTIKNAVSQVLSIIKNTKDEALKKAKIEVKDRVYHAYNVASSIYFSLKDKVNQKQIEKIIIEAIKKIKLKDNGYFFVVKSDGYVLLNSSFKEYEGKNFKNLQDNQGKFILKKMSEIALKRGEGFYSYNWYKPEHKKFYKKISYVKYFKPLDFYIGTGIYIDNVLKTIQKDLIKKISFIRFGKEGYIFINKFDGTAIITDGKIVKGNKKLWELFNNEKRKEEVKKIFQMEKNAVKNIKGGYFICNWEKLKEPEKLTKMLVYVAPYNNWKWIIGSGVFLDEIEGYIKEQKEKLFINLMDSILANMLFTIFLIIFFIFVLNKLIKSIDDEFHNFRDKLKDAFLKNIPININDFHFKRLKELAKYTNNIIEERKKLLEELKKSEEKFRKLFENSSLPMFLLEKDGFIDCNLAAVKMFKGKSKKDILGKSPIELSPEFQPNGELSKISGNQKIINVFQTKKPVQFEWQHKRLDGTTFYALVNLTLIPFKDKEIIFVICVDITDRKILEKELEEEKELLETTLTSIAEGVIVTDEKGEILLMNKTAENIIEYNFDEVKCRNIKDIFQIKEPITNKPINFSLGKNVINYNCIIFNSDCYLSLTISPIKDKSENIRGYVFIFRDITQIVLQEKELIKSEKLKSLGVLAGGIAHDFNNILTGISGNLELIKNNLKNKSIEVEKIITRINKMEYSIKRAINLTNQLLTFSKGYEIVKENVDLKELIINTVEFNLSGSAIKPIYNFKSDSLNIVADKGQLSHVIANLIINAKEAMNNEGKIYISVDKEESPVINGEKKEGTFIKISIKDEGSGIDKEILDKIFDPFFTTKSYGNGLGLSIVYSIIEKHNGYIVVKSEKNKGAEFIIYLPEIVQNNTHKVDKKEVDSNDIKKYIKNVLIIDDNKDILDILKEMFNILGINCLEAENFTEAKNILKHNDNINLIISDLTIPGDINIMDFLKNINDIPVIIMTGYSENDMLANYKKYGFKGALKKPFTFEDLKIEILKIFIK